MKYLPWFLGLVIFVSNDCVAEDWPIFRGPDRSGISKESFEIDSSSEFEVLWSTEVGLGYSAPIIANGLVYITGHIDGEDLDRIFVFDEKTGESRGSYDYSQSKGDRDFQGGTTGSVTVHGDRLYHLAREGGLFSLDISDSGLKEVWSTDLVTDHGYSKPTWGFSGGCLTRGDRLYVNAGKAGVALNRLTGQLIWKSENEEAGYSTPVSFNRAGEELLIFSNKRGYVCSKATDGESQWSIKWMTRWGVNASDPIVDGSRILIATGYDKGASLFSLSPDSNEPSQRWRNRDMRTQMNAAILIDGYLYGIDVNEGQAETGLKCMELSSGETVWSDLSVGFGAVSVAGNHLLVITEKGELQIAEVNSEKYQPIVKKQVLKPKVWTVPVVANGRIYCRNAGGHLVVLGKEY